MLPSRDSRLVRIVLVLFFIFLVCYALYEARGILYGPAINVPEEAIHVTDASTVIRGRAERITELRLNGKQIPVRESGEFEETFLLAPGSNYFFLEARNARGRIAQKTLVIIYTPSKIPPPRSNVVDPVTALMLHPSLKRYTSKVLTP